jgi:hypothetical protein
MTKKKATPPSSRKRTPKPPAVSSVSAQMVETPFPHLEVRIAGPITSDSVVKVFERVRTEINRQLSTKKVLVDLRQGSIALTISDLHGLAKMVATNFVGAIDKLAFVMRAQDILPEKFLEPSLTNRGLPTLATEDLDEAIYWLGTRFKPAL